MEQKRVKLNKNILIVDDDKSIIESMERFFQRVFENCFTAYNGLEALAIIEKEKIDYMLTDMVMPRMDGYNLILEVLKRYPEIKHMAVLTGHTEEDVVDKIRELNIPIFIKPINIRELKQNIIEEFEGAN